MTDQLDTAAIRAQMEALDGHTSGPWRVSPTDDTTVINRDRNVVAEIDGDYNEPDLWPIMESNARLIATAPDMRATIRALCDEVDRLRACVTHITADIHDLLGAATDDEQDAIMAAWARLERPMPDTDAQVIDKLRAENERLRGFIEDFAACKFDRIERRARDPQDDLDPLTDYLTVEAWQDDARIALV